VDEAVDGVRVKKMENDDNNPVLEKIDSEPALPRQSARRRKPPDCYGFKCRLNLDGGDCADLCFPASPP